MALILMPMGLLVSVPAGGSPEEIFEHTLAPLIGGERQPFRLRFQRVQPAEKPARGHDCPPQSVSTSLNSKIYVTLACPICEAAGTTGINSTVRENPKCRFALRLVSSRPSLHLQLKARPPLVFAC